MGVSETKYELKCLGFLRNLLSDVKTQRASCTRNILCVVVLLLWCVGGQEMGGAASVFELSVVVIKFSLLDAFSVSP